MRNRSNLREGIASSIGATKAYGERFTLYIPNKGRSEIEGQPQIEIADWPGWIRRAIDVLAKINGGATSVAPATALYMDRERGNEAVWEKTVIVYSFIDREQFRSRVGEVRDFMLEFGRETRQGGVFFEFDGFAYEINPPYGDAAEAKP